MTTCRIEMKASIDSYSEWRTESFDSFTIVVPLCPGGLLSNSTCAPPVSTIAIIRLLGGNLGEYDIRHSLLCWLEWI